MSKNIPKWVTSGFIIATIAIVTVTVLYFLVFFEVAPYAPKSSSSTIKGDQGIQGIQGDRGIQGDQGILGIPGIKGDQGDQGDQGVVGPKGDLGNPGLATNLISLKDWMSIDTNDLMQIIHPDSTYINGGSQLRSMLNGYKEGSTYFFKLSGKIDRPNTEKFYFDLNIVSGSLMSLVWQS